MKTSKDQHCAETFAFSGNFDDDFSSLCKALGHPARVKLVRLLVEKGVCISGDLADAMDLAPSTVSEHLRILKGSGLVAGTIDGPRRCYCVSKDAVKYLKKLLAEF